MHVIYNKLLRSFVHWSAKFSLDRSEQPFNALLMISCFQLLLVNAIQAFYALGASRELPFGKLQITFIGVAIFFINFSIMKRMLRGKDATVVARDIVLIAPLFALFCAVVFILSVIMVYIKG
ncbi:MAG: hypothetical protein OQK79_03665 [Rhodanobacter sp.]|jgi:hypothetical protein|nr:hypothetical protein [Rhodanobacter sp.]